MTPYVPLSPVRQTLAAALSFYDAFREVPGEPPFLRTPLKVSIPSHNWAAHTLDGDGIYRFSYPSGISLPDTFEVAVESERGDYINLEPLQLSLPLSVSAPPLRSDFWILRPLWPTRTFEAPATETVVVGRIESPTDQVVSGLQVWMHTSVTPPPASPYTFTDSHGEFLFRFPGLPGPAPGGTQLLHITLSDASNSPVAITPSSLTITLGRRQFLGFERN